MGAFKAAAQAGVAVVAVTKAIARHLVQNRTGLGGSLVSGNLRIDDGEIRKSLVSETARYSLRRVAFSKTSFIIFFGIQLF